MTYPEAKLTKRGNYWWVYQSVPYHLRPIIGTNRYHHTTDTKDKELALSMLPMYQEHFLKVFEEAETQLKNLKLEINVATKAMDIERV